MIDDTVMFTLRWFCREHTNGRSDVSACPSGMLFSLISQLLSQLLALGERQREDFDFSNLQKAFPSEEYDLGAALTLFEELILALSPRAIVFCIIDGISYYEDRDRKDELEDVLKVIMKSVEEASWLVKLLVTAPQRTLMVGSIFEGEILNLLEKVSNEGGFKALQWDGLIGSGTT